MKNKKLSTLGKVCIIIAIVFILIAVFNLIRLNSGESDNTVDNEININEIITEEIPDGSFEGESQLEVEGFEEENPDFVSGSSSQSEDFVVGASVNTNVYYSQIDSRWKNLPYSATGNKSQTVGSSGCGPTSAAMVISTIKGIVYPNEMADLYVKNGFRSANNGTYLSAFEWTANKYGIEFSRVYSVDNMINLLRNNYMVIVSVSDGLFTTGGHIMVVYGIDGNTLKIYDPYLYNGKFNVYGRQGKVTVSGNTVYCSIDNFKAYANSKAYFGFKRENSSSTSSSQYTSGRVLVDIPIRIAWQGSTKSYDDSLVDSNGYQFWIKNSVIINNHVYGLADICYDGGETDILQIFDRQFWCREIYMSNIPVEQPITIPNTVGQTRKLKSSSIIYQNSNLSGTRYNYKANTTITILQNISTNIDRIRVNLTGREGFINISNYK